MRTHSPERPGWSTRGSTLVEFALVLPILLVLSVAATDLGRAFFTKNVLHQAAREGVRLRVVLGDPLSSADYDRVVARVETVAGAAGLSNPTISIGGPDATTRCDSVSVTADFHWVFPGLFRVVGLDVTNPMPLTATCYMKQE
jgi:Flp pilus assembly protein TadG